MRRRPLNWPSRADPEFAYIVFAANHIVTCVDRGPTTAHRKELQPDGLTLRMITEIVRQQPSGYLRRAKRGRYSRLRPQPTQRYRCRSSPELPQSDWLIPDIPSGE